MPSFLRTTWVGQTILLKESRGVHGLGGLWGQPRTEYKNLNHIRTFFFFFLSSSAFALTQSRLEKGRKEYGPKAFKFSTFAE